MRACELVHWKTCDRGGVFEQDEANVERASGDRSFCQLGRQPSAILTLTQASGERSQKHHLFFSMYYDEIHANRLSDITACEGFI